MTRQRLFILQPTILAHGQVNNSFDEEYPTLEIPVMSTTVPGGGTLADVARAGQMVVFGSAAGEDDLGRQRIRRVFSSDELLVGLSSRGNRDGEINAAPEDYWTLYDHYGVWAKMPTFLADGTEYKDGDLVFASEGAGTQFPPVANAGPGFAGEIDPNTGVITVAFDGSESYGFPVDASIATYLWDFADGTVTVGSASSATATVTFPAGFRWIHLTVTDDGGGTHTAHVPILADDPAASLCVEHFQVVSHRATQRGQEISFLILSDIPRDTFIDGTLVMFWEGEAASPADRSHMQFIGWHHADSASVEAAQTGFMRNTVIECLDVAGKLDTIPALPQIIVNAATPAKWGEMYHPTTDKFWHYLLHYHTTALEVADYFDTPQFANDLEIYRKVSSGDTMAQQINNEMKAMEQDRLFCCNRQGQLYVWLDLNIFPSTIRPVDEQADLEGYIQSIRFPHTRAPRVGWIRGSAVIEGWDPLTTTIDVQYTINVTAEFFAGATSITVEAIPVALPSGAELVFSYSQTEVLSAPASIGATTLSVVALTDTVDIFIPATVTLQEDGPTYIPTVFCIAPGTVPGQGIQHLTMGNRIVQNQAGLNVAIGNWYARLNAEYGLAQIVLRGNDNLGIDPGMVQWVASGDLAGRFLPQRALPYFPCRGIVTELVTDYEYTDTGIIKNHRIAFERETSGPSAQTITGDEV